MELNEPKITENYIKRGKCDCACNEFVKNILKKAHNLKSLVLALALSFLGEV